jgi:diguanylate cyclase (GGDEF)-like protein
MSALWAAMGAWAAAYALALWALGARRRSGVAAVDAQVALRRKAAEAAAAELERMRARVTEIGREHRESLAFYGMVKGLSEAITWEDLKPRLDGAIDAILGASDYGLYTMSARAPGQLQPLTVKRLDSSPGGSWNALERYLQERGLSVGQAFYADSPEPAVGLPVAHNNEVLGYFYARAPKGMTPQQLLAKAQGFVDEIGFAFRRVKLFQEVEALSRIDGLTGVYRRGDFEERLRHEIVRAKTFKTTLCVMLLDIDHFKRLNDRYGHPFGDQVLRRVGELLNASVYDTDFVARYGGEEFVVVLPRAEPEGALRKAEAIRRAVEDERFALALETIRVTVSIGVAHFPRDAATPEELVGQADAALYRAKSDGRNRVVDCTVLRR